MRLQGIAGVGGPQRRRPPLAPVLSFFQCRSQDSVRCCSHYCRPPPSLLLLLISRWLGLLRRRWAYSVPCALFSRAFCNVEP